VQVKSDGSVVFGAFTSAPGAVVAGNPMEVRLWIGNGDPFSGMGHARVVVYTPDSATGAVVADSGELTPDTYGLASVWREDSYVPSVTVLGTAEDFPVPDPVPLINPAPFLPYGEDVDVTRAGVVVGTLHGVGFDPGTSYDSPDLGRPERVVSAPSLLAVYGSGVQASDSVSIDGVTYYVDGHPKAYKSPLTGRAHGDVITLTLTEG
jgi:hypothetical protein